MDIAKNDDQSAFKQLFLHFYPKLNSFANSILSDKQLAEDVVAEVFMKLWENRQMLSTVQNVNYYLYIATKHTSLNLLKKQKRMQSMFLEDIDGSYSFSFQTPETKMISREAVSLIELAIKELPPKCRLIFYMVKEEKLKHKEISQILDISTKTIEAQITIALKKISDRVSHLLSDCQVNIRTGS